MIIQPQIPGGFTIFCDDIREEVNGKRTFVGAYNGEMTVFGTSPVMLPKICMAIRFRVDPEKLPLSIVWRITKDIGENEEILFEGPMDAPALPKEFKFPETVASNSVKLLEIGIEPQFANLIFTEPCVLRVKALIGDDEYRVGSLSVKIAPIPQTKDDQKTT